MSSNPIKKDEQILQRYQFSNPVRCSNCGQTGEAIWEKNNWINPLSPEVSLVSISSEFYERLARKAPYPIELVCYRCGTVQPE